MAMRAYIVWSCKCHTERCSKQYIWPDTSNKALLEGKTSKDTKVSVFIQRLVKHVHDMLGVAKIQSNARGTLSVKVRKQMQVKEVN